ncbi:MAG: GNAT family N-acetyltransferase [Ruminococcaceae bacterium]|nr:GNAT family N-acetyltransferase [Oscillospiraceae bacterium]
MTDTILRHLKATDVAAYKTIYEEAFPLSERKPFDYMTTPPANQYYELLVISTSACPVAGILILAYTTVQDTEFALLDYFAIAPSCRGQGLGHHALSLAHDHCLRRNAKLFLEIEAPDTSASNAVQRIRRKAFYFSCGLVECGVAAWMYDTVMELLAYPQDAQAITLDIYRDVVKSCYPAEMGLPTELPQ